jgi:serine/threonine-protein kinase HipA
LGDTLVGYLTHYPDEKSLFVFDEGYVNRGPSRPVMSLLFARPGDEVATEALMRGDKHRISHVKLPSFFSNLLPEGGMRRQVAAALKVHEDREFDLLKVLGGDLPGSLVATPADTPNDMLAMHKGGQWAAAPALADEIKFSLAGVQLKFSLLREGDRFSVPLSGGLGNYILKPPTATFEALPRNEYAMMLLAREVGIDTPDVMLVPVANVDSRLAGHLAAEKHAYAVRRFDRTANGRVHIEDLAQALGARPTEKYGFTNYETLARVLMAYSERGFEDVLEMTRRLAFNLVMGNGDAHIKNWSLIYNNPTRPRLAPAYDLVATIAYTKNDDTVAMNMGGVKRFAEITMDTFRRFAERIGMPENLVVDTAAETIDEIRRHWEAIADEASLPDWMVEKIRAHHGGLQLVSDLNSIPVAKPK